MMGGIGEIKNVAQCLNNPLTRRRPAKRFSAWQTSNRHCSSQTHIFKNAATKKTPEKN